MSDELRILILEDRPTDAELMLRELQNEAIAYTPLRVETEMDFRKQLHEFRPGLILADHGLPTYDGMSALAVARKVCPDVPFILVSDSLGEDQAVESLLHGATDYVLKQRLFRLGAAVRRALHEVEERNERKQAEETRDKLQAQFLQVQKMESIGRLAGGIAHDFNNLLTVINGLAELAAMGLRDGDPLRLDLEEIARAGERAAMLTRQLLAFSRKQVMQPVVLNLSTVVAGLRSMLQRVLGEEIELVLAPGAGLCTVRADPAHVEQVIMNLVVNARDAISLGGRVTIETRDVELGDAFVADHPTVTPGPHVLLAVSDTGVGMDEVTRLQVFDPFFTTKEAGKGTGLGLSTVYGIVKQSGGSIWVSGEIGRGTTFTIYLPRVAEEALEGQPVRTGEAARGRETVLVVEDDQTLRHLTTRMLQSAGYTVLTASNGDETLRRLARRQDPVHLMLTDVVMPGICGSELVAQVAKVSPGIKVLYTSGYTDDAILRHGVLQGTTSFISKPFTIEALTRKVREVLNS